MILDFINNFKSGNKEVLEDIFTNGFCYWFAFILRSRFGGKIYYNQIMNHFAAMINECLYDITGIISSEGFEDWEATKELDSLLSKRVIRDCILKEELGC